MKIEFIVIDDERCKWMILEYLSDVILNGDSIEFKRKRGCSQGKISATNVKRLLIFSIEEKTLLAWITDEIFSRGFHGQRNVPSKISVEWNFLYSRRGLRSSEIPSKTFRQAEFPCETSPWNNIFRANTVFASALIFSSSSSSSSSSSFYSLVSLPVATRPISIFDFKNIRNRV